MLGARRKQRVKERDGWKCKKCNSREQLTIDHIVPVALGGSDEEDNLQTLCRGCNTMKADKPPTHKTLFNLFFSRKTIYEFKNEIRSEIATSRGMNKAHNEKVREEALAHTDKLRFDWVEDGFKRDKAIRDLEAKHKDYINRLVKRIHYLESYLKIEWVEETTEVKEYRKIKKVKKQK